MDVDEPPRAVSVPLQRAEQALLDKVNLRGAPHLHRQGLIGSSPVASLSAPSLTTGAPTSGVGFTNTGKSVSPTNSNPSLDELMSPCQESESGRSVDADNAPSIRMSVGSEPVFTGEVARTNNFQVTGVDQKPGAVVAGITKHSLLPCDTKGEAKAEPTPMRILEVPAQRVGGNDGDFDPGTNAKNSVIDYKLPRELHLDISPPLLSSYQNPICMVIQDMREQRMSLCQSLRQYVFVHAVVIEGALQIIDEEQGSWGDSGGSDDGPELDPSVFENAKESVGSEAQDAWIEDASARSGSQHFHFTTAVPASSVLSSSPSKGKRGPSPTELLKEDKTGALSLAKRPSVKRKTPSGDEIPPTFESNASVAGPVGVSAGSGIAVPLAIGPSSPEHGGWSGPAVE